MAVDLPGALPDLPNAGYATARQKALTDNICDFMRQTERDRFTLLTIVIEGIEKWRKIAGNIWRGYGVDNDALDAIFHYFELQAATGYQAQLLAAQKNTAKWRDIMTEAMPDIERQRETIRLMDKWGVTHA